MTIIDVQQFHRRYRDQVAVRDVSLTVERGEIFGIVGPNDAGKTTTVECIAGLRAPDGGTIRSLGLDPERDRDRLRSGPGCATMRSPPGVAGGDRGDGVTRGRRAMAALANAGEVIAEMKKVRQARLYSADPVPDEVLNELLEIARWTGSARNTQPWHFIVVTDKEQLRQLSELRTPINWVAGVPLAIAIVTNGAAASESYDEGRVTERLFIGARVLGLGGGTAWFGEAEQQARAKEILGIPQERAARSVVALGYPTTTKDHRPNPATSGRKPLSEIVSYGRMDS